MASSEPDERIIVSLGGSLLVPEAIDIAFVKAFKKLILEEIKLGRRFKQTGARYLATKEDAHV